MSNEELQQLVQKISIDYFKKPFQHTANFNNRLKTTGGRYHLNDHHIDINPRILSEFGMECLIGTIKHELCHYHLHLAGQTGGHGTRAFKQLLSEVHGLRYSPIRPTGQRAVRYLYQCVNCGQNYPRKRRIDLTRFVCSRCHHKLRLVKQSA
ncbi:SprT family protein [Secundilactobacillus malefermentans]|uniref:SprT family protein n=1 Tax=Secundilactobacillus malefermentans TaxID=176292 RepID=UPI0011C9BF34|nr:SprT family protein [Secundilactobacillus malefermentans]QEA31978.1 SprT family protein [Secundilactobacillus malefermentans]